MRLLDRAASGLRAKVPGLAMATAVLLLTGAARAQQPTPPITLADLPTVAWGVGVELGATVPTGGANGVASFLVDGRFPVDITRYVQLALAVQAAIPGVTAPTTIKESDIVGSGAFEARVFPFSIGFLRPYAGFSVGYAWVQATTTSCDGVFGCNDTNVHRPGGLLIGPIAGLRYDIPWRLRLAPPRIDRMVSLYAEVGYDKVLTTPAALDRFVVKAGPGVSF